MENIKNCEDRKTEILNASEALFNVKGYEKTTINDILQQMGIAKGTLYYYYKSKEEILDAIAMRIVEVWSAAAKEISMNDTLTVHQKMIDIILAQNQNKSQSSSVLKNDKNVNNSVLHEKVLVNVIKYLAPIMFEVVEEGISNGDFHTAYPIESVEFLLINAVFLFEDILFGWTQEECVEKALAYIHTMEVILGAEKGSFSQLG